LVSNSLSYGLLSNLFYIHKLYSSEEIVSIDYKSTLKNGSNNLLFKKVIILFFAFVFIGGSCLTYQYVSGLTKLNVEHIRSVDVTAHRGASLYYPENTISSFNGAYELGADYVELDLQQTKDREIVVTHDSNLYRVTGLKKEVNDITYDKLKKLDAGGFFDKKYKDERIPLLRDVIEFAKEKGIKLNIELKPTGREVDFEKDVVDIIHEYDFQDSCVVTSQSYETLKKIKKEDEAIKTVYVMVIAIGNITKLDKADAFSVEAMNVNSELVRRVHNAGKEVYVWTINTEDSVNRMVELGVDNIITDDVTLVKSTILKHRRSNLINRFIEILK
jgi:glycerophosphoryl diester phosphodiesterase